MIDATAVIHPLANLYHATVGPRTKIANFVDAGRVTIGADCKVQAFAFLAPGTVIGDRVFIGPGVTICNDDRPRAVGDWICRPVTIEDDASIGAGSTIRAGVTIGRGAFIGQGSNVTDDVPPGVHVRGNPSKPSPLSDR